jgi:hypothetical protein
MSIQNHRSESSVASRRAELLVELFFQELNPVFISRPTIQDLGYDLLVGFSNESGGINTFAVEVKATERPMGTHLPLRRANFNRMAHSNVPGLLLVADVKQSRLYYSWLRPIEGRGRGDTVSIPLTEISDATKEELKKQFQQSNGGVAAAG